MRQHGIPICYFPTTAVFVDDNKDFLMNLSLQFDTNLAYRIFVSPIEVLETLTQPQANASLHTRFFSECLEGNPAPGSNHTIHVDVSAIHQEVYNPDRFKHVSVLVVDYSMPGLNGLELCEKLIDHPCKKILLTGQADEKLAVRAFNDGLIDHFLLKSDPDVITSMNLAIKEQQQRYFMALSEMVTTTLAIHSPSVLRDPKFIAFFHQLCAEHNIVEYYMTDASGSFLLLDENAKPMWLVVKNDDDIELIKELAEDNQVDASTLTAINQHQVLPFLWRDDSYYQHIDWQQDLHPAKTFQGAKSYYYSLIDQMPSVGFEASRLNAYQNFLDKMDAVS